MKKLFLVFLAFCFMEVSYATDENLYETFKDHPHIKVYLKEVTSEVNDPRVKINEFERIFDDVHRERVNIKFIPVKNADEANVVVTAKIKGYVFNENVLPSFFGTAALIADTATPKSAAKLVVDYKIIDAKTGKVLAEFRDFATDERRPVEDMKGDKAFEYAAAKNINRFIYKTFRKQREKAHEIME